MTEHLEYFKNKIQAKLEQLPRAIKGDAPKETLDKIVQEIDILKDTMENLEQFTHLERRAIKFLKETDTMQFSTYELLTMFNEQEKAEEIKNKMIQDIIISGPLASGKSWIADAIAMTHKNVIETTPGEIYDRLETSINNLSDQYSLLIIDDCKTSEIQDLKAALDDCFQKFDNWSGKWLGRDCIPTIFLTQDHVKKQEFENQNFKIIYCNYNENVL